MEIPQTLPFILIFKGLIVARFGKSRTVHWLLKSLSKWNLGRIDGIFLLKQKSATVQRIVLLKVDSIVSISVVEKMRATSSPFKRPHSTDLVFQKFAEFFAENVVHRSKRIKFSPHEKEIVPWNGNIFYFL